jgi:methionine-rich copper-binding protein CopC
MRTFIFAILAIPLMTGATFAHAVLVKASPPVRGSISGADVVFRLQFNSRIDAARSTLKLLLPGGDVLSLAIGPQSSPDTLSARTAELGSGRHVLRWQVLAADGHITRGEVPFDVR